MSIPKSITGRPKVLLTPAELFKKDDLSWNGSWENISYDQRLKYILMAVEFFNLNLEKNFQKKFNCSTLASCKLNIDERTIYMRHMGAPEIPPFKPVLFFKQHSELKNKNFSNENSNSDIEDIFSKLSKTEKFGYYKKQMEAFEYYVELEKIWKIQQKNILAVAFHTQFCKKITPKLNKNIPKAKKIELKEVERKVSKLEMETFSSVFKFPPMTIHKLLKKIYGYKEAKANKHVFLKSVYFEIINDIKQSFKKEILDYVDKLDISDKKLFIGINRKSYVSKFWGEDIFEKQYPSKEFPAFCGLLNKSLKIESDEEYMEINNKMEIDEDDDGDDEDDSNQSITDFDPYIVVRNSIRSFFENLNSEL